MKPFKAGRWTLEEESGLRMFLGDGWYNKWWRLYGPANMWTTEDLRAIRRLIDQALRSREPPPKKPPKLCGRVDDGSGFTRTCRRIKGHPGAHNV